MKEQTYVARYRFHVAAVAPERTSRETQTVAYVLDGNERVRIGPAEVYQDLIRVIHGLGGVVVNETEERCAWTSRPEVAPQIKASARRLTETLNGVPGHDGAGYVSVEGGFASVRTPTRLGQPEHMRRRALVEAWFRGHEITFTLECATEHSDRVCRPIATAQEGSA